MHKELVVKNLWFLFILLNLMPLLPDPVTLVQSNGTTQTETQVVFVANATRQTIDRIELTSNAPAIQSISEVGMIRGLQLADDVLYSFTTDDSIYATQLDKSLNPVITRYIGNVAAAGAYAGNSVYIENDGSILTAGRCGVASFTQQAGTLAFQAVRLSGENIVRLTTDTKNHLYVLTVGGAIYQVPQSRDWSAIKDTGWRIPRPSGFQVDGKKLSTPEPKFFDSPAFLSYPYKYAKESTTCNPEQQRQPLFENSSDSRHGFGSHPQSGSHSRPLAPRASAG